MNRFARFFCDPLKVIKFIAVAVLGIVVVVYAYLQSMGGFDSKIETETSYLVSLNETVEAQAYVFRDETVISGKADGTIVTVVSEGDRVSKGQMVANVFSDSEDATLQDDINRVQRKLDILEDSAIDSEFVISDLNKLDKEIEEIFTDIYAESSCGNLSSVIDKSSQLLINIFMSNTPLHDGAAIVSDNRIKAGACFLPLALPWDSFPGRSPSRLFRLFRAPSPPCCCRLCQGALASTPPHTPAAAAA